MEKHKQRPIFIIDVNSLRLKLEEEINRKIQENKDPNLNDFQKRVLILSLEKTRTFEIKNEINTEKEKNENDESSFINNDNTNDTTIDINDDYYNKSQLFFQGNADNSNNSTLSNSIEENKFNSAKSEYYERNKFYDILLNIVDKDVITPEKYKINDKLFTFVYPDNLNSYYISESRNLLEHKKDEKISNINNISKVKYYKSLGLYFCEKIIEIQIEKDFFKKKCTPNEFMCKDCMKINKNKYHINNKYLININGRVSIINKGKYHCFCHFLCSDKKIYDCINKYSCKACIMLDTFSKYFEE